MAADNLAGPGRYGDQSRRPTRERPSPCGNTDRSQRCRAGPAYPSAATAGRLRIADWYRCSTCSGVSGAAALRSETVGRRFSANCAPVQPSRTRTRWPGGVRCACSAASAGPGSAPAPVPAQLKQVVHASADEVDVRVVESGDDAMPERVDHARTRPDQSSNVASSPTAVMRPADTASAAASGRARSPVEIRPLRRTRSAVRALPGRVAAVVAMAVLGRGRALQCEFHAGVRLRAGPAAGGDVRRPTAG
jgi:hypothetical protein